MLEKFVKFRKLYGDNWLTTFENLEIPWRQLTFQEFLNFDKLLNSGYYKLHDLEDEIFSLAVLEPIYIENIDILPAGIITTVVAQIMQISGPLNVDSMSNDLNNARYQIQDFVSSAITMICSVFPAYKPEEVLSLRYDVFMKRLAMSEKRLLELGVLKEPLSIVDKTQNNQIKESPSQSKKREALETKRKQIESKLSTLNSPKTSMPESIITTSKINNSSYTFVPDLSSDPGDYLLNQKKIDQAKKEALSGLESIYPEYFKALKDGKKITPEIIQKTKGETPEEVKKNLQSYIEKVQSGEIVPKQPVESNNSPKPKVKVKRR